MTRAAVRLGLIGAGRWGRNIIRTVRALDGADLVRIASRNPATRELVDPHCVLDHDWRTLIGSRSVDGVIIATPPALHVPMATACLDAGLAVMVEKPLALSAEEARRFRDRAAAAGGPVLVDHTHLFHPAWAALLRRSRPNTRVKAIRARAGNRGPFRSDVSPLWDWGPHDVAMCLDLMEADPDRIDLTRLRREETADGVGEVLRLELSFAGTPAVLEFGNAMNERTRWFEARLDDATVVYDGVGPDALMVDGMPVAVDATPPLTVAIERFIDAIRGARDDLSGLDLAVRVVEILARCAEVIVR